MKAIKSTHFTDYIQIIYEQFTKKNPHSLKEKKKGGGGETTYIRKKREEKDSSLSKYKCISEDHSILKNHRGPGTSHCGQHGP